MQYGHSLVIHGTSFPNDAHAQLPRTILMDDKLSLEQAGLFKARVRPAGGNGSRVGRCVRVDSVRRDAALRVELGAVEDLQRRVRDRLYARGISVESVVGNMSMYHVEDLPFAVADTPDVFTQFRRRVESGSQR